MMLECKLSLEIHLLPTRLDAIPTIFEDINEKVLKDFTREIMLQRNVSIGNIIVSFQKLLAT